MPASQFRLITIPMSHYCEKARWGLERLGLKYHEERHLQCFHYPRTYWVSRGANVPVLIDGNKVIADSTNILKHLDQYAEPDKRLYPEDLTECAQVDALEELFDEVLGIESRRCVYHHFINRPIKALRTAGEGAPITEKILMPLIYPLFMLIINSYINPTKDNVESGLQKIREIIKKTDSMLENSGPYLLGARFTAADLTLASMMAPLVLPTNYGIRLPKIDELPAKMRPDVEEFINTRTGKYVLSLFNNEKPHRKKADQ